MDKVLKTPEQYEAEANLRLFIVAVFGFAIGFLMAGWLGLIV